MSLDERFDPHLAQAENLTTLFVAVHDGVSVYMYIMCAHGCMCVGEGREGIKSKERVVTLVIKQGVLSSQPLPVTPVTVIISSLSHPVVHGTGNPITGGLRVLALGC